MKFIKKLLLKLKMLTTIYNSLHGVKILHKSPLLNKTMRKDICRSSYEEEELNALKVHLARGDKVLELGACVGLVSAFAAKKIGSENVVTVEANPTILELIDSNHKANGVSPKVVHGMASTVDSEKASFYVCENICSSSHLEQKKSKEVEVPTVNVNRLIEEESINFLVVDIEGGENDLIPNINFEKINKILLEVHPYKTSNASVTKLLQYIISQGYFIDFATSKGNTFMFTKD